MRHRKAFNKLNRTASHRKALLANMTTQLFTHKRIKTTAVKAKAVRPVAERLITFAKKDTLASRRQVLKTVRDKTVIKQLFNDIAPTYQSRPGGYTRIVKLGQRQGDGAELAYLELVGFESVRKEKKAKGKKSTKKTKEKVETETPAGEDD
ncbi:MAG TPA: 50S ribosomal protein L17 [bacterium]|mgnify:CR=1 FL=1|nr:50S ribosomal protein L17 [bacterium]